MVFIRRDSWRIDGPNVGQEWDWPFWLDRGFVVKFICEMMQPHAYRLHFHSPFGTSSIVGLAWRGAEAAVSARTWQLPIWEFRR